MDEKGLGRRLQDVRVKTGLTQQALCHKAGLSYSTLTKIERGAIKSPSIFTIKNIAAALGVSLDELMGVKAMAQSPQKRLSRSGVRFVFFDVNGCLLRFYHRAFTTLAEETSVPIDAVENAFWIHNDKACRGEMTADQFNAALAKDLGVPSVDWLGHYMAAVEPIEEMYPVVKWVADNYHVGLLTNLLPGFVEALQNYAFLPKVNYDVIVTSPDAKSIKPETEIYDTASKQVEKKAGCEPKQILLVDDTHANIMAAAKCGWHVLWFDDYQTEESISRIKSALEFA